MLVALGTQGWVAAVILLAVLIAENQLEAHVLQPLIVGRYVGLHPLLIGIALAVGSILGRIMGALVSVPVAAVLRHTLPVLLERPPGGEQSSARCSSECRDDDADGRPELAASSAQRDPTRTGDRP